MKDSEKYKRLGVTQAIRDKLDFQDERKWKRFSARRLELIDTLDLSSKKASEQEAEISRVAEALRIEFEYPSDCFDEFDRLVRAAIQSVRRNRKRSSKSKRFHDKQAKLMKTREEFHNHSISQSPEDTHDGGGESDGNDNFNSTATGQFVSEIAKLTSDSQDDHNEYSKTKHISDYDKSREAINTMVQPRVTKSGSSILNPQIPLPSFDKVAAASSYTQLRAVRGVILNFFERSKTCSEATLKTTSNLEFLGKGIIIASVGYVFEKSFFNTHANSLDYLRGKLTSESYLANIYRELDPSSSKSVELNDETAVMTLSTLLGGCTKDFGFEPIMIPLCELFYLNIVREYPLVAQSSIPFKSSDYLTSQTNASTSTTPEVQPPKSDSLLQLNSLAAVASDLRQQEQRSLNSSAHSLAVSPTGPVTESDKKAVALRFLSSTLNFTFPQNISATPKLDELLENARSAFHLSSYNDSQVLGLKNMKDGFIIKSDADLERIFMSDDSIELELFTQKPHAIPIYEITSMVVPNKFKQDPQKIILPPPVRVQRSPSEALPLRSGSFKFLSNLDEPTPPPTGPPVPVLPKFQPLL